jgi:hypothetical protein
MPVVWGQSCHYAIFDICSAGQWNGEGSFDGIVPVGDVPESGVLREKLSAKFLAVLRSGPPAFLAGTAFEATWFF